MEGPERLGGLLDPENGGRTQCTLTFLLFFTVILIIQENELHEAERIMKWGEKNPSSSREASLTSKAAHGDQPAQSRGSSATETSALVFT